MKGKYPNTSFLISHSTHFTLSTFYFTINFPPWSNTTSSVNIIFIISILHRDLFVHKLGILFHQKDCGRVKNKDPQIGLKTSTDIFTGQLEHLLSFAINSISVRQASDGTLWTVVIRICDIQRFQDILLRLQHKGRFVIALKEDRQRLQKTWLTVFGNIHNHQEVLVSRVYFSRLIPINAIVSFLRPRNLRRRSWWDHFAVRPWFGKVLTKHG